MNCEEIGILQYLSDYNFSGKVFQRDEDFIVEEIPEKGSILTIDDNESLQSNASNPLKSKGNFLIFTLVKRDLSTHEALDILSRKTHVSIKRFGYLGNKDRNAITAQRISVFKGNIDQFSKISHPKLFLKDFYYSDSPCKIGNLYGNHFDVLIRDFSGNESDLRAFIEESANGLPNFYGPQRFGDNSINIKISKAIIDSDFSGAVDLLLKGKQISDEHSFEYKMKQYLEQNPNDFIGALRLIPKYLRLLIVQSFQYNIYNKILSECIKENIRVKQIPLIGYDLNIEGLDPKLKQIFEDMIKRENIDLTALKIKSMPEASMKSVYRDAFFIPEDLTYRFDGNNLQLSFTLRKGSYASILLIEMLHSC